MKPRFLLQIDLSGIINCNTFSVRLYKINENTKNVLFHYNCKMFYCTSSLSGNGQNGLEWKKALNMDEGNAIIVACNNNKL
jgi:hypothetical protein